MKKYRLLSTPAVHTPGIVNWAINAFRFPRDREVIRKVMRSYPGLPEDIIEGLLSGALPFDVVGDVVEIYVVSAADDIAGTYARNLAETERLEELRRVRAEVKTAADDLGRDLGALSLSLELGFSCNDCGNTEGPCRSCSGLTIAEIYEDEDEDDRRIADNVRAAADDDDDGDDAGRFVGAVPVNVPLVHPLGCVCAQCDDLPF